METVSDFVSFLEGSWYLPISTPIRFGQGRDGMDYTNDVMDMKQDELDPPSIDRVVRLIFMEYVPLGRRIMHAKADLLSVQNLSLQEKASLLDPEANPVIIPVAGETEVYPDKRSIGSDPSAYAKYIAYANRKGFEDHDACVLLSRDAPLHRQYLNASLEYNSLLDISRAARKALSLWVNEAVFGQQVQEQEIIMEDLHSYRILKKAREEAISHGPLSALRFFGLVPLLGIDYLAALLGEYKYRSDTADVIASDDLSRVFIVGDETGHGAIDAYGVSFHLLSRDDFRKRLFLGSPALNDIVIGGYDVKGSLIGDMRPEYGAHSFDNDAVSDLQKRAYLHLREGEMHFERLRLVDPRRNPQQYGLMQREFFGSLGHCMESLRYAAFAEAYEHDPHIRLTARELIERESTPLEKLLASASAFVSSADVPRNISVVALRRLLVETRSLLPQPSSAKDGPQERSDGGEKGSFADYIAKKRSEAK